MTNWPNWIDLIVVTILLKTCYSGFGRGFLAEVLNLIGAVSATALTLNYASVVTDWLRPWFWFDANVATFLVFGGLFLILIFVVHVIVRRMTEVLNWERLHWAVQGLGLVLGALRGLWWSGVILVVLISTGFAYLHDSVDKSVLGPRLVTMSHESLGRIADRFPGAAYRSTTLVPPIRPKTK